MAKLGQARPPETLLTRSGYVRMSPDGRLRDYPFVVVRFACRACPRVGRCRLAVLAEHFGADADLATALEAISASCPRGWNVTLNGPSLRTAWTLAGLE